MNTLLTKWTGKLPPRRCRKTSCCCAVVLLPAAELALLNCTQSTSTSSSACWRQYSKRGHLQITTGGVTYLLSAPIQLDELICMCWQRVLLLLQYHNGVRHKRT